MKINENESSLTFEDWNYEPMDIQDLKKWVDNQIKLGVKGIRFEVDFGREHYELDSISLNPVNYSEI